MSDLGEARYKAKQEHEDHLKKVRTEAKMPEERILVERNGALSCCHCVLRSIRGIVKATNERNTGYTHTLTKLRLLFEERRKMKAVPSSVGPSVKKLRVANLESALDSKNLEYQTLPGLAAEYFTLRTKVSRLKNSAETLGRERKEFVIATQDVRELASHS